MWTRVSFPHHVPTSPQFPRNTPANENRLNSQNPLVYGSGFITVKNVQLGPSNKAQIQVQPKNGPRPNLGPNRSLRGTRRLRPQILHGPRRLKIYAHFRGYAPRVSFGPPAYAGRVAWASAGCFPPYGFLAKNLNFINSNHSFASK
jgi:hypothetical protein